MVSIDHLLGIAPIARYLDLDPVKQRLFISPRGVIGTPWTHVTTHEGKLEFAYRKGDPKPDGQLMIGVDGSGVIGCVMVATFRANCRTNDAELFYCSAIMPREALIEIYRSCKTCGDADAPYGRGVNLARRGEFGEWFCRRHRP